MLNDLLNAPCIFCGYSGANYYQPDTHSSGCPWRIVGGGQEREAQLPNVIKGLMERYRSERQHSDWLQSECNKAVDACEEANRLREAAEARESRLRSAITSAREQLNDLLIDEDLDDEKLREASEGLLPNIVDRFSKALRPAEQPDAPESEGANALHQQ